MSRSLYAQITDSDIATGRLLEHEAWIEARPVQLKHYWSGELAPPERHAEARALWTEKALFVRFVCRQNEPLVVSTEPQTTQKSRDLFERDVCEIFIAPNANEPERYFEFEAAPTGEWLDLAIHQTPEKRETDWNYASGMTVSTHVEDERVTIVIRIPFEAFSRTPQKRERWRANLFRCLGAGETRGYLAWQPTRTERPNFHVPEAFGWITFIG